VGLARRGWLRLDCGGLLHISTSIHGLRHVFRLTAVHTCYCPSCGGAEGGVSRSVAAALSPTG
jgi:hypothetical protein